MFSIGALLLALGPAMAGDFDHSHASWDAIVRAHVRDGVVDYSAIQAEGKLDAYLAELDAVESVDGWTRDQQLAYWINAYNAYTVDLIVDNLPVASIRNLGIPVLGPWKLGRFDLPKGATTLDNIEHGIIREEFDEPRIHFALVCASVGCPPLRSEAFVAARLDAQLEDQTRTFFTDPTKNRATPTVLELSKIFKWYGGDFEATGGVRAWAQKYMDGAHNQPITYQDYDWSLNGH